MAGDAKKLQPIIIKRVKKGGHGHHGGAWKIAYADFVTAMMAFFLLMWLLGSTSEGDKKGIADYFQSPLKVALLNGGSGSGDSSSVIKGGGQDLTRSGGQVKRGDVQAPRNTINLQALRHEQRVAEATKLQELSEQVENELKNNAKLAQFASQIKLDLTRDGLRIQIVDELSRPMFDSGSAIVKPYMRDLLRELGIVLDAHGKMPDVVIYAREKNWLILVESVTSHGPVDSRRQIELKRLFEHCKAGLVFVSAFPDRRTFLKHLSTIAWESDVWIADAPTHLIHFNGTRFLGPY